MKYKTLLFASILINVIVLTRLLSCQKQELNELDKSIASNFIKSSVVHKNNSENTVAGIQTLLERHPLIGRYVNQKIKLVVGKIDSCVIDLESLLIENKKDNLIDYEEQLIELNHCLIQNYDSLAFFIEEYIHSSPKETIARIDKFKEKIALETISIAKLGNKESLIIAKEINKLRILENLFLESACMLLPFYGMQLTTQYYPIVVPENSRIKKGEKFKAEIYIGNFIINRLNDYQLKINEQEQVLTDNRLIYETKKASKIGENKLQLSFVMHNPLTGEISKTNSEFSYIVTE